MGARGGDLSHICYYAGQQDTLPEFKPFVFADRKKWQQFLRQAYYNGQKALNAKLPKYTDAQKADLARWIASFALKPGNLSEVFEALGANAKRRRRAGSKN
jgi:hypothetical protein